VHLANVAPHVLTVVGAGTVVVLILRVTDGMVVLFS
jgi:hypothetical protein